MEIDIYKGAFWYLMILSFFAILIIMLIAINNREMYNDEKALKDEAMDLLLFSFNVTEYCAEQNNQTYQELLNNYLRYAVEEMLEEELE